MAFQTKYYAEDVLDANVKTDRFFVPAETESVRAVNGDVLIKVPIRERKPSRFSARFEKQGPKTGKHAYFRIRLYNDGIVRLGFSEKPSDFNDKSEMLQFDSSLRKVSAHIRKQGKNTLITDGSKTRFILKPGTFAPIVLPDGKMKIEFQDNHIFHDQWVDAFPMSRVDYKNGNKATELAVKIDINEHFCGTGERFETMDLYGKQLSLINDDGLGTVSNRAYKNIPFFMSSRGYGIFMHTPSKVKLDLGQHSKVSAQMLINDNEFDIFFIAGNFSQILERYRKITGYPPMLPVWSFGSWQSRSVYHSDAEISTVANRLRNEKYPMDVIHIDPGKGLGWSQIEWRHNKELYPDLEGFFKKLNSMGFHTCIWVFPWVNVKQKSIKTLIRKGIVGKPIKNADMGFWDDWHVIDFSNPKTVKWYGDLMIDMLKKGPDAIKTDFCEKNDEDAVYYGMEGKKYRNMASILYAKAIWDAGRSVKPEFFLWQRSAWAGCQRYPLHWDGDAPSDFSGLTGSIRGGLHFGLSGFAFWSHDIPGYYRLDNFRGKPDDILYLRWTQFGVFSSHMRFHGTYPREPYEYPTVSALVRQWLRFRYALIPYIIKEAQKCCKGGLPMVRSLVIDWTDDPIAWSISDQYLFGSDILACPVANEEGVRDVYLPKGSWVDFWTGETFEGPFFLPRVKSPLSRIPLYVKRGAKIPLSEPVQHTGEMKNAQKFTITFDGTYKGFAKSRLAQYLKI